MVHSELRERDRTRPPERQTHRLCSGGSPHSFTPPHSQRLLLCRTLPSRLVRCKGNRPKMAPRVFPRSSMQSYPALSYVLQCVMRFFPLLARSRSSVEAGAGTEAALMSRGKRRLLVPLCSVIVIRDLQASHSVPKHHTKVTAIPAGRIQ